MVKRKRAAGARWMTAALAAAVISMGAPAVSHAWSNTYCGVLINSGSWCGDGSDHTYDYNSASYGGSGSVWVCERLLNSSTRAVRSGSSCAYNFTQRSYNATSTLWEAEVTHWSGSSRHTITGYAIA